MLLAPRASQKNVACRLTPSVTMFISMGIRALGYQQIKAYGEKWRKMLEGGATTPAFKVVEQRKAMQTGQEPLNWGAAETGFMRHWSKKAIPSVSRRRGSWYAHIAIQNRST